MGRNFLKGKSGDRFNVKAAALGYNFKRLIQWFRIILTNLLAIMIRAITAPISKILGF